jgi:succinate dehydrogenase/fumarate reductase flavoprotein subunit
MPIEKEVSRRSFIKVAAVGAGATALGGLIGTVTEAEAAAKQGKWNKAVDVVVVGYGGAGAAAAIAAHDAGAKVLILEKDVKGGGSTYFSGGFFVSPRDVEGAVNYLLGCAKAANGQSFDIDKERLTAWAKEATQNEPWMRSLGAADVFISLKGWYDIPGAASYTSCQLKSNPTGVGIWDVLSKAVSARKIEVIYNAQGSELVIGGGQKQKGAVGVEALGIVAEREKKKIAIQAKKAIILTCGGFDYDESMKKNYLLPYPNYSVGHLGNTGDAIKLAAKTGADLWHMNGAATTMCHKFPEVPVAYPSLLQLSAMGLSVIFVSKLGKRFTNEAIASYDAVARSLYYFDAVKRDFPNIPCWCIFDEKARVKGPAGLPVPIGKPVYTWSPDNSAEIAKGWIVKGDTIPELAGKIGVDAATLENTVTTYNGYCAKETDPDFGRKGGLIPLDRPPYYAVKGYPGLWATGGGPRTNTKAQVLDTGGKIVRRLYVAGSASTFAVAFLYPLSGTAIGDCFAMGRIAGRNASAEKPW